jgi:hypothetical protein
MTREDQWTQITDLTGRLSALEEEARLRGPRHDEIEGRLEMLTRDMDHVLLLGRQALTAIGDLTRGLNILRAEVRRHTRRSLKQIFIQRWDEVLPWAIVVIGAAVLFPEVTARIGYMLLGISPG